MFSKASIKRPVTTVMCLLIVIGAGLLAMMGMKLDLMPSISIPVAIVSTTYVGAGPEEIESLITEPLEETLGTVSNVDSITSTSSANSSMIVVQFVDGTDVDMAALDMREKIDMVKGTLPDGANDPMVMKIDVNMMSAMMVGVGSDTLDMQELNTLVEDDLVPEFEKIEGTASVSVIGGDSEEVEVALIPEKMKGYGLTAAQISQVLAAENINYPTGSIQQGSLTIQTKTEGKFKTVEEIAALPLTTPTGAVIHLSDVADVNLVDQEKTSYAIINGEEALMLMIQKQSDANTVEVSDDVVSVMNRLTKQYPQVQFDMLTSTSDYIKDSVSNIISTALQAAVLAVIVIFVFLRSPRMSFIIGVSIPSSILATFALMWACDMTMNMISMGGIAIGIGMLVDNSIVVLENVFSHAKKTPDDVKGAAARGASEVAMAVTASTLTTVGVFLPMIFVSGTVGDMMHDLSLTICFSLLASLVVSLTFVPMACSKLLNPQKFFANLENTEVKKGPLQRFLDAIGRWLDKLDNLYRRVLGWSLVHKKRVVALVLVIFVATLGLLPIMGFDFMPEMDEGAVSISVELPNGTELEKTTEVVDEILSRVGDREEIDMYYAMVGGGGVSLVSSSTNTATIYLELVGKQERSLSSEDMANQLSQELSDIAGCDITVSASSSAMGSYGGTGVTIRLNGDENDELRRISDELTVLLSQVNGVTDVESSAGDTVPEVSITIDRARASMYGLTATQIGSAISTAITGSTATQFSTDGTEIDVVVRQKGSSDSYLNDLQNMTISTATGAVIPLTEVAQVNVGESSVAISRESGHRYIDLTASIYGRDMNSVQKDVNAVLQNYAFPDGYTYSFTGTLESMNESFSQLLLVLLVAVLLVYMIMASQFESFIYPFIVMFSMPIALTGGILGLFIAGKSITTVSFMGFIMLVGMVVNNAIVLVDKTNQNVEAGMTPYEAVYSAGPDRLRPILMTTLTTVLGMVPLALALTEGTEMQQPMALVIIFGLSLSTLITLIFIPVLYLLVDKFRKRSIQKKHRDRKARKEQNRKARLMD